MLYASTIARRSPPAGDDATRVVDVPRLGAGFAEVFVAFGAGVGAFAAGVAVGFAAGVVAGLAVVVVGFAVVVPGFVVVVAGVGDFAFTVSLFAVPVD